MHQLTIQDVSEEIFSGPSSQLYDITDQTSSGYHVVTGQSLLHIGCIDKEKVLQASVDGNLNTQKFVLKKGDVLFLSRGHEMRAAYVDNEIAKMNAIPSANFIIIRPSPERVLGEFLVAYLNSSYGKSAIQQLAIGSSMPNVPLSKVRVLPIPVPPLAVQSQISAIFFARNKAYLAAIAFAEQQYVTASTCIQEMLQGE